MSKIRPGSKMNSYLNGEWCTHAKKKGKKYTSKVRRALDKQIIKEEVHENNQLEIDWRRE